jgi:hypothetical protein
VTEQTFEKVLTANDTGESGAHQAGIHVPKNQDELIAFLPALDPREKNPSVWLEAVDEDGGVWRFRYIYYNNRLHDPAGTRDEFRITHMTRFLRSAGASAGDTLIVSGTPQSGLLRVSVRPSEATAEMVPARIHLKGWRRVH